MNGSHHNSIRLTKGTGSHWTRDWDRQFHSDVKFINWLGTRPSIYQALNQVMRRKGVMRYETPEARAWAFLFFVNQIADGIPYRIATRERTPDNRITVKTAREGAKLRAQALLLGEFCTGLFGTPCYGLVAAAVSALEGREISKATVQRLAQSLHTPH